MSRRRCRPYGHEALPCWGLRAVAAEDPSLAWTKIENDCPNARALVLPAFRAGGKLTVKPTLRCGFADLGFGADSNADTHPARRTASHTHGIEINPLVS